MEQSLKQVDLIVSRDLRASPPVLWQKNRLRSITAAPRTEISIHFNSLVSEGWTLGLKVLA